MVRSLAVMKIVTWNVDWWQRLGPQSQRMDVLREYPDAVLLLQECKASLLDELDEVRDQPVIRSTALHPDGQRGWSTCAIGLAPGMVEIEAGLVPGLPRIQRGVWTRASVPDVGEVTFVSWHAENAADGESARVRKMQAYSAMGSWLAAQPGLVVLGGDINSWRDPVDLLEAIPDPFEVEHAFVGPDPEHGLVDAWRQLIEADGRLARLRTDHPDGPLAVSYRLSNGRDLRMDRIFTSPELGVTDAGYEWDASMAAGSDHALHRAELNSRGTI